MLYCTCTKLTSAPAAGLSVIIIALMVCNRILRAIIIILPIIVLRDYIIGMRVQCGAFDNDF